MEFTDKAARCYVAASVRAEANKQLRSVRRYVTAANGKYLLFGDKHSPIAVIGRWCDCRMMVGGYLAVFVGGGLGSAFRHLVNRASLAYLGPAFPYGTLIVNVVGGLLMGVLAELFLVKGGGSQEFRLFLTTGFLGGFTTFSAFSLDAALMWQRSDYVALGSYIVASVLLSIAALFVGMAAVRGLT